MTRGEGRGERGEGRGERGEGRGERGEGRGERGEGRGERGEGRGEYNSLALTFEDIIENSRRDNNNNNNNDNNNNNKISYNSLYSDKKTYTKEQKTLMEITSQIETAFKKIHNQLHSKDQQKLHDKNKDK